VKVFYPVTVYHILVGTRVFSVSCTVFAWWIVKRGCGGSVGTVGCVVCLLKAAAMLVWLFGYVVLFGKVKCKLVCVLNYGHWHGDV